MDLKKVANTLNGAYNAPIDYGANVNATPANQNQMANLQAAHTLSAQGDRAGYAIGAMGGAASEQASQEAQAARDALAKKEAEMKFKEEEERRKNDPNNYKAMVNDAGGYDFYDPNGNPISAVQYARKKNMQISDVYKDSQDPNDRDFIDDYNLVMDLGKAVQSGDAKARDKIYEKNPEFKEAYGDWTFKDIVGELHKNYPGYFRGREGLNHAAADKKASELQGEEEEPNFFQRAIKSLLG